MSETVPSVVVKHKLVLKNVVCKIEYVLRVLNQQRVRKSDLFSIQSVEAVILCRVV